MATSNTTSLAFTVRRQTPELVAPAKPTPHELKPLSDIDDQEGLRFQIPVILFYPNNPSARKTDPVKVIREAIAKALVFYYPVAGRLREGAGKKLSVECTSEGVLFTEADADVTLDQFGDQLQPPFPCLDELLYDVPGSGGDVNCPLMLFQVTRLSCGGFLVAVRHTHTLFDAPGLIQFLKAVGEIARGASTPSVLPVWQREVLRARDPPRVRITHREYSAPPDLITPPDNLVYRSFFFSYKNISTLRNLVPHNLRKCSVFELLTACLWRCRTAALQPNPEEEVRIMLVVSARGKFEPDLPVGYYGNAIAFPVAISPAGKLCKNPLGYALELVIRAKAEVNEDYLRSVADLMVIRGRPQVRVTRTTFLVSDVTRSGFGEVDFGWGKPVYGGPAKGGIGPFPSMGSFYVPLTNKKGERGIVVPFCLPAPAMERFALELDTILNSTFMASAL